MMRAIRFRQDIFLNMLTLQSLIQAIEKAKVITGQIDADILINELKKIDQPQKNEYGCTPFEGGCLEHALYLTCDHGCTFSDEHPCRNTRLRSKSELKKMEE